MDKVMMQAQLDVLSAQKALAVKQDALAALKKPIQDAAEAKAKADRAKAMDDQIAKLQADLAK